MSSVCILRAYTAEESFGRDLAGAYRDGALKGGHRVEDINIYDLSFDQFNYAYVHQPGTIEHDLQYVIRSILGCDHLVIFVPVYKAYIPSVLLAFFNSIFYTDAFGQLSPAIWGSMPFLHMKTGRIISTLDQESWQEFQKKRDPRFHPLKKSVLEIMGFKKVRTTTVPPVYEGNEGGEHYQKWLKKIFVLGETCF